MEQKYKLFDVVEIVHDMSSEGINAGAIGTIVMLHDKPELAYEVEFTDKLGCTIAQIALKAEDIVIHKF